MRGYAAFAMLGLGSSGTTVDNFCDSGFHQSVARSRKSDTMDSTEFDFIDNVDLENTQMNLVSAAHPSTSNRIQKLSRGNHGESWLGQRFHGHYFNKSETFHPEPLFKMDRKCHGFKGQIHTSLHPNAPIMEKLMESFIDKGLPLVDDMFATGTTANGYGHCARAMWNGIRSAGGQYLRDFKVLLDDELRAVEVKLIVEGSNKRKIFHCRKEIVLILGSYNSPKVPLLSGIGPKEDLYEVAVQPKADIPGVGKNLEDHLTVFVFYEATQGFTTDHLFQRQITLSRSHFGAFAVSRLDERLQKHKLWKDELQRWQEATGSDPIAVSSRSRGYVKLKSLDPNDGPIIQHNYLSDPIDVLVYSEACKIGAEIMLDGKGSKDLILRACPPEDNHTKFNTLEQWETYVRENATTCFHPSGTCKMEPDSNPGAVVDAKARVKEVKGLRVANVSIMPKLNNGQLQAVAYAIGEKCANMMKEDWGLLRGRDAKL
ncbi:GMC oxidoreductase-domain-containing protein [Clohesyomyces aquaticus]|uniref:GMC oxidoreductase-domain-containing protein n=1 Tax=Clohesyomyces aquaticus TaxID=1231657 RepID=A0A1Y1Z9U9_9PLEO|nr:GMC oxidoreductase-domain-containing protein [Clohesyomyces aquaticus]